MILLSGRSRRSLLALIVILAQICLGFGAALNLRQDEGDSDSDSDDDETSESCRNGVCTTVTKGQGRPASATPTGVSTNTQGNNPNTQGSNPNTQGNNPSTQSSNPNGNGNGNGNNHTKTPNGASTTSGILPTSGNPIPTGGNTANNNSNNAARKRGLSTGGIVGLVIGLLILAGLIAMLIIKRRSHQRQARKRPRGLLFLPSTPASQPDSPTGEMTQASLSPSTLSPGAVAAAHLRTVEGQHSENYGPLNLRADGASTSYTPLLPSAQYSDGAPTRQATLHSNHTNTADTSFIDSLPSPHETTPPTSWSGSAIVAASAPSSSSAAQKALPNTPSDMHTEMTAYQKALERDDEKSNQPSGSRTDMVDPPPVYTD